jgi:hypothetical protein
MSAANTSSTEAVTPAAAPADWRKFWRVLLAVVAPIPGVALAISNAVTPAELGGSTKDEFAAIAADPGAAQLAIIFSGIFILGLVPSAVALMMAYRRSAPRFTTLVIGFVALGFLGAALYPDSNLIALVTSQNDLDAATITDMTDKLSNHPLANVWILPFFLTITVGRVALGVLLWRVRLAPRWMAAAMLLATPVEFILVSTVGNIGPVLAYALTAIGFASASVVLLRMSNDEFDLPPLPTPSEPAPSLSRTLTAAS